MLACTILLMLAYTTGETVVGRRGGSWYVEGCWGFAYSKKFIGFLASWLLGYWFLGFKVSWFSGFQSFKFSKLYRNSISCSLEDIVPMSNIFKNSLDRSSEVVRRSSLPTNLNIRS